MTTPTDNLTAAGLPANYDKPATFGGIVPAAPAALTAEDDPHGLAALITVANRAAAGQQQAENAIRNAGRAHLAFSCLIGACVTQTIKTAAAARCSIKPLFANYADKGSKAARLSKGAVFAFSYEHGLKCRKVFEDVAARMLANGCTEEQLDRAVSLHMGAMLNGEDVAQRSLQLFGNYLQADNMRQALLALFPQPAPELGERVAAAVKGSTSMPLKSWEDYRADYCMKFTGYLDCIGVYVDEMCKYTTKEDRERQAEALETAARRLRAAATQYDLPGIAEA